MNGRKARFVPGWDTHGLPIELKVLQVRARMNGGQGQGRRQSVIVGNSVQLHVRNYEGMFLNLGVSLWGQATLSAGKQTNAAQPTPSVNL